MDDSKSNKPINLNTITNTLVLAYREQKPNVAISNNKYIFTVKIAGKDIVFTAIRGKNKFGDVLGCNLKGDDINITVGYEYKPNGSKGLMSPLPIKHIKKQGTNVTDLEVNSFLGTLSSLLDKVSKEKTA